jgi:sensor histidine kinase YesM
MDAATKRRVRNRFFRFFSKKVVYHSLFWLIVLFLLIALNTGDGNWWVTFSAELINVFFYAVIVYYNFLYLIPNYLTEKKFLVYGGLLIVFAVILTPIKILVLYFLFSNYPEAQFLLIHDQAYFFLSNFVVAGSSTIVKIISDWARHQRERKDLQTQTMQSELRFLKSQINPHFLFNTLNNLYALTLKKSDKAPEIVIKLSEMMRYMLYDCNEKRVLLSKEVQYIRNYLDLEQLRQGKKVDIDLAVEGNIQDQKIAPLMFIPFLENSFKHGLSNVITHGYVKILVRVEENELTFFIENSKPERLPLPENRRVGGIGLVNVRRRLNLQYPDLHQLRIRETPQSYAVELKISL